MFGLSTLLATRKTSFFDFLKKLTTSSSIPVSPGSDIHHKNNGIRFLNGKLDLLSYFFFKNIIRSHHVTTCIND